MGFSEIFTKKFRQHYKGLFPCALPFHMVEIGDYGELRNDCFIKLGNVKTAFGISFTTTESVLSGSESFNVSSTIDFSAKGEGKFDNIVDASMKIGFHDENSIFFNTVLSSYSEMVDPIASVQQSILALYKKGDWKRQYVIVSSIEKSKNTILAISENAGSEIILSSKCDLPNTAEIIKTDAAIELEIRKKTEGSYVYVNKDVDYIVPRFQLMKLKGVFYKSMTILSSDSTIDNQFIDENIDDEYDDDIEYQLNKVE